MPVLLAGIDVLNAFEIKTWMAGTSPAMTARVKFPRAAFSRGGRDFMGVGVYPSSRPHLLRAATSSSAGRQNANGRDKPGHCNVEGSANRFL
jgi:hypothetical protein